MKHSLIIFFVVCVVSLGSAQHDYIRVLPKDCVYVVPLKRVIVMDDYTFGEYHHYRKRYDTLKQLVIHYEANLQVTDSLNKAKINQFTSLSKEKDRQIEYCENSYQRIKNTLELSIQDSQHCSNELVDLKRQYNKQKKKTKAFKITTLILSIVTAGIIAL